MSTPVNFSAGYVPPGIYVSTKSTGSVAAVGVGDTVVCLVGRGIGHMTATEVINFGGGTTYQLGHTGIDPTAANITVIAPTPGAIPYMMDVALNPHDYSLTQSGDAHPQNRTTTLVRTATGTIPSTGNVLVRYNYTDPDYYALHSFTDYATFVAVYGPALDPVSGAISSPLTLAAQLAFQNGARVLYAVAINNTVGTTAVDRFNAAYALTGAELRHQHHGAAVRGRDRCRLGPVRDQCPEELPEFGRGRWVPPARDRRSGQRQPQSDQPPGRSRSRWPAG